MSEISKNNKEIGKTIATKVPINIHNQLINLIENGDYLSISDFLREAIREQLKTYKVEIAIDLELDFELVYNILNDLIQEGRIVKISNEEMLEKRGIDQRESYHSKDNSSVYKIEGKRLIVESRSKDYEFISIRHNRDYKSIFKNSGSVVENASVILSEAYSFIK